MLGTAGRVYAQTTHLARRGGLLLGGLWGLYDRMAHGHVNANYGSIVTWGLWVATYIYFIGLSAGAFLVSSLAYVFNMHKFERIGRLAVVTALVTLLLAVLSTVFELGHMERSWHVMAFPDFRSPMAWVIWLYAAYMALLVIEMWLLLRHDLVEGGFEPTLRGKLYSSPLWVRVICLLKEPLAIAALSVCSLRWVCRLPLCSMAVSARCLDPLQRDRTGTAASSRYCFCCPPSSVEEPSSPWQRRFFRMA